MSLLIKSAARRGAGNAGSDHGRFATSRDLATRRGGMTGRTAAAPYVAECSCFSAAAVAETSARQARQAQAQARAQDRARAQSREGWGRGPKMLG